MKWLVFWTLIQTVFVPCPDPPNDVYGRSFRNTTAVACYSNTYENKSAVFDSEKEALEFIETGKKECDECVDWRAEASNQ